MSIGQMCLLTERPLVDAFRVVDAAMNRFGFFTQFEGSLAIAWLDGERVGIASSGDLDRLLSTPPRGLGLQWWRPASLGNNEDVFFEFDLGKTGLLISCPTDGWREGFTELFAMFIAVALSEDLAVGVVVDMYEQASPEDWETSLRSGTLPFQDGIDLLASTASSASSRLGRMGVVVASPRCY